MKKLLIWDIDGTLIHGGGIGKRSMDKAFLEIYGIVDAFNPIHMAGMLDPVILNNAYNYHHIENGNSALFYEVYLNYLEQETKAIHQTIACPGIAEILQILEVKCDIQCVLGTGNIEKGARLKLSIDNLNSYFPTGGFGTHIKERWEVIVDAYEKASHYYDYRYDPQNVFVIGDTPRDIESAQKAGFISVGVATGKYSASQLSEHGAQFVFEDLGDSDLFLRTLQIIV